MGAESTTSASATSAIEFSHIHSYIRTKNRRFETGVNGCYLCWQNFSDLEEIKKHLHDHLEKVTVPKVNASWRSVGQIQPLCLNVELIAANLIFQVTNTTGNIINIIYIGVYNDILQFGKLNPRQFPIELKPGDNTTLRSTLTGLSEQNHYIIMYEDDSDRQFEKVQSYHVTLQLEMIRIHHTAQEPIEFDTDQPRSISPTENSLQVQRINNILKLKPLPSYHTPINIQHLFYSSFTPNELLSDEQNQLLLKINQFRGPLTPSNYIEMLTIMAQIEDYSSILAIANSTKINRTLIRKGKTDFVLKLTEREGRPLFLLKGDNIWLSQNGSAYSRINGFVEKVTSEEIWMNIPRFNVDFEPLSNYSIHFEVNRLTYLMEREALENAKSHDIVNLLFPEEFEEKQHNEEQQLPKLQYYDPKVKSDASQMEAVKHIVAGTAYPLPYLLIGYPGTGKTKVIVESICQLFSYPKNRILVCASSNTVCDEIAQKLITLIKAMKLYQTPVTEQYNIIRLYATTVRRECKGEELLENSNFEEKSIPCLEEIYKYRIVVCTLTVSGRLAQGEIDTNHFTHLFIDECENAAETYTLIPIAGVCSSFRKINAHIVMSGDPKQLGPIVRSTVCKNMNLDVSMFQRLFLSKPYQKDSTTNTYNRQLISKLRNNYRSHPKLVNMPNKLFYGNEMRSSANIGEKYIKKFIGDTFQFKELVNSGYSMNILLNTRHIKEAMNAKLHRMPRGIVSLQAKIQWLSELEFLPIPGLPILFEHIDGCPETKENCLSWYNAAETDSVLYYVEQLLNNRSRRINPSDIGIISPYKRQCILIEESLEKNGFSGIEVGSVEQFQGKEKPIIIVSTVRNGPIGFLQQRERINVMLTRAIGLLIIIGHKSTLYRNADWKKVIDYIIDKCDGEVVVKYNNDGGEDEIDDYRC